MTYYTAMSAEQFDSLRPSIASNVKVRHYDDGIVAWSPSNPRPTPLEGVSSIVFQVLDGSGTVADLLADIQQVVGVPESVARAQLRHLLDQFDAEGLLDGVGGGSVDPTKIDLFPAPPNP